MADGHLNKCKACTKRDVAEHRATNLEQVQEYDRQRGKLPHRKDKCAEYNQAHRVEANKRNKEYHLRHPDRTDASRRRWAANNPQKRRAHFQVSNAIRDGKLFRLPCAVCGSLVTDAHHEDYSKPLDVIWLCRQHHLSIHATRNIIRKQLQA